VLRYLEIPVLFLLVLEDIGVNLEEMKDVERGSDCNFFHHRFVD